RPGPRDDVVSVLGHPLVGTGRALGELVVEAEQHVEEAGSRTPLRRRRAPGDLEARRDGIGALASAVAAQPTEALSLERRRLRLGADEIRIAGSVRLAERVTAVDQCDRLLVVHGHPAEGLAD